MIAYHISPRTYLTLTISGFIFIFSLIIGISIRGLFFDKIFGYQILYGYQLKKMVRRTDVDTIFVGDSSLGNAIDAQYFSAVSNTKTLNLALTGLYGYSGPYNMVKRMVETNPIRNIVIMQTIDMLQRPTSYAGYIMTVGKYSDITELERDEKNAMLMSLYDLLLSPDNLKAIIVSYIRGREKSLSIKSDYIQQNKSILDHANPKGLSAGINPDKVRFLLKIIKYCNNKKINLIYVHGPIWHKIGRNSGKYIKLINSTLKSTHIRLVSDVILIDDDHLGDSTDHVAPEYKKLYTEKYFSLLKPFLRSD